MKDLKCPFCKGDVNIVVTDDEGNLHNKEYEQNPWSGLGYMLYHDITMTNGLQCPIAKHRGEGTLGITIYDSKEEAAAAWSLQFGNDKTSTKNAFVSLEMPEKCNQCSYRELHTDLNQTWMCGFYHLINKQDLSVDAWDYPDKTFPEWCPLTPFPQKMTIECVDTPHHRYLKEGWNLCLSQIMKDKNI